MLFQKNYQLIDPYSYFKKFKDPQWYLELKPELSEYFYNYYGNKEKKNRKMAYF